MADFLLNPWELVLGTLTAMGLGCIIGFAIRGWFDDRSPSRRGRRMSEELRAAEAGRSMNGERSRSVVRSAPFWVPAAAETSAGRTASSDGPEHADGRERSQDPHKRRSAAGGPATTVLVVDDRLDLRAIHSAYLEKHGYHVITAADGDAALELAREYVPAVMLLDHSLPKRNGVEVARALTRDPATAGIRIVLMTAHSYGAVGSSAMAAGCTAFLSKPCDPSRVLEEVARLAPAHGAGERSPA